MGKGSSAPKAPDYGPLTDFLKTAMTYAQTNSTEMMDWAKKTYEDNKAVGGQVIDWAMGQMDKQAAWSDADRQRYEDVYQPLEDQAAQRAQDYASPERQEFEAGKAEADVAAQFNQSRQASADRLEQFGVDPSQVRQGALDLGTRVAEAAAQASAGNQTRFRTEQYGDQLMANAINTGKGYPAQTIAESSAAGQSANQATNTGLATTASGANTMGTSPTWAGLGMTGAASAGQMLNAGYQNKLAAFNANQQASSGWGSALGLGASILTAPMTGGGSLVGSLFAAEGGAIPDDPMMHNGIPVPPEASPSGGAITDDVPAQINGGGPAQLNAGEFIIPKDVVSWIGEKGMQNFIMKARKEMGDPNQAPAQPETGIPPDQQQQMMIPPRGVGAIPDHPGAMQ
jgi:hypothetical protein